VSRRSIDIIQFLQWEFCLQSSLSNNHPVYQNIFMIKWIIFSIWSVTSWNSFQNLFLAFCMEIVYEHLFQCVTLTWHSDIRNNATVCMFNAVAGTWIYLICNILKFIPEPFPCFLHGNCIWTLVSMCNTHLALWHKKQCNWWYV
jgi:hypothetical protein